MRLSMRVWDLPVRVFHVLTVLLLLAGAATAATHHLHAHILMGESLLTLLVWRAIWFAVGSDTAKLGAFLVNPGAKLGPPGAQRSPDDSYGHAAAGGWLVPAMLALLLGLVLTGLIPQVRTLHPVFVWLVLAAIAAHLVIIAIAAARTGDSPLRVMISGKKRMPAAMKAPRLAGPAIALIALFCAAGAVILALNLAAHGLSR